LPVVDEDGYAGAAPAAEDEEAAGERVVGQLALAEVRQGVDALAPVDFLDGHQHAYLRGDLQHLLDKLADDRGDVGRRRAPYVDAKLGATGRLEGHGALGDCG